ncbi:MAG: sensor domain-containing diguanylate cyclase [Alphaproteobacteria bacterium]
MAALIDPKSAVAGRTEPVAAGDALVRDYPGPALRLDRAGCVAEQNAMAEGWRSQLASVAGMSLRAIAARVAATGNAEQTRVHMMLGGEERVYDIACVAAAGGRGTLLLGRDATADMRLTNALILSRQMFKDLVACSSDFAWETDPAGVFSFVSRPAALGYDIEQLDGEPAASLLHPDHAASEPLPFTCAAAVEDVELWLRRADGSAACFLASATPVRSREGELKGHRGVCRDVTALRAQEAELHLAHERERLSEAVVDSIRNEVEPAAMLGAAVSSTAETLGARHGWLVTLDDSGDGTVAASTGGAALGAATVARLARRFRDLAGEKVLAFAGGGRRLLAAACVEHGTARGVLCVARGTGEPAWQSHDRQLLAAVAPSVAVAITQAEHLDELRRLSRTDDLTGLPNRRAFLELVEQRLRHLARTRRGGAVLFCDLDNFKLINDLRGHAAGDDALCQVADLLRAQCRIGDIAARLGGDEFVVWLEEVDAEGAEAIARRLQERARPLGELTGVAERPFGMSIGIVAASGADVSVDGLLSAADEAMYVAKKAGKGGIVVAESPANSDGRDGS